MPKALTTHLRKRDFYAALVADHAAMLHALILAAQALPVGDWAENARAKQAVAFRFERTVVDGLRLGDFAVRPAPDLLRRSKADANRVEVRDRISEFKWVRAEQFVLLSCPSAAADSGLAAFTRPLSAPGENHPAGVASCGSNGGSYPDPQKISRQRWAFRPRVSLQAT